MAAAIAVGFVLGALPLVISAVEHYEDVLRPFVRYRKFSSKLQRFHDELEVERTIFRTECLFLLAATVKSDTAADMLDDRDHHLWKDNVLRERFGRQLGVLGFACESVISKIEEKLDEISAKTDELNATMSLPIQKERLGDKNWRHRVGQKLKFSFTELGMQRSMTDLRKLNRTFQRLSNQVVRLDARYSSNGRDGGQTRNLEKKSQALERFQMVQKASTHLYGSLTRACTTHSEHLARFSLETACSMTDDKSRAFRIRFHLAFTNADPGNFHDPASQIRFSGMRCSAQLDSHSARNTMHVTEQVVGDIHERVNKAQPLHSKDFYPSTLATLHVRPATSNTMAWFEVQSFIGEAPRSASQIVCSRVSCSARDSEGSVPPDLDADTAVSVITKSQDFCARLGTSMHQSMPPSDTLIGVLEETATQAFNS